MQKLVLIVFTLSLSEIVYSQQCSSFFDFRGWDYWEQVQGGIDINGDANGDGYDDVIISVGYLDYEGNEDIGATFVFSGRTGDTLFVFYGEIPRVYFGSAAVWGGDINNDGYDDIIVGSYGYYPNYTGRVYVFSGFNGDTLHIFDGENELDGFGERLASAGDVDNDGHDDILVGVYRHDNFRGRIYVYSGRTGDSLFVISGHFESEYFGITVSTAGDVNGDGFDDFMATSIQFISPFTNNVTVFSGFNGDTLHLFSREVSSLGFGVSIACAGDVNADGHDDLIIGDTEYPGGGGLRGRVYVFSGADGDTLRVLTGEHAYDGFGSVAGVGDVDNDGFDDFVVAAGRFSVGDLGPVGRIYVFSGGSSDTLQLLTGNSYFAGIGRFSPSTGDVNGDGLKDLAFGAIYYYDDVGEYLTRFSVYSANSCQGTRGDINGDGTEGDMLDLNELVNRIFRNGPYFSCFGESDVNSDGSHGNILDLNYLVNFLFRGGQVPGPCN